MERILYSGVPAIGNTSTDFGQVLLGAPNGPGFGWRDVTVVKLGAAWAWNDKLTLRAGWNHTDNPVTSKDVFFNTIAPGVVQEHATLGFTYALTPNMDLSGDYVHAFKNSVTGALAPPPAGPGGSETLSMTQDSVGLSIGYKF